jgi:hypothetical protein
VRKIILNALKAYYVGEIGKHKANIEVFLENPVGVGDHPDVIETLSKEVMAVAEFEDALQVLDKHFAGIPKI